ncbi:ARM repeat-containing protein [Gloeophyllum trabeum ATCC 11539]|uniref:non-specific serine/threonine protein kinase n=1 Tax=Gloeophyllum trabeum (strain ATCC 11539 / FP-39264 / Madison 617) TaxID=670483 RepID=S7PWJ1_GLOTA|nr:ARM repeat-containing protein [Gloeophyllum trabeum ATCC 11539]EPQ51918.1 ARM repeat-containing protein [Gloeophyllum trabeum ATCC 11539]
MGNAQSGSTLTRTGGALDSFVAELGNDIVYEKSLGSARFLKTVRCRHRYGHLVVKIFIKPDPGVSLRNYHKRLKIERDQLQDIANVYGYQTFVETERAAYIIRQWVASNLYDRISTRPFLSMVEKKWIAFQLLTALRDARNRKVSHGDIKSENILVTSWNWVYISDFASYKPTYLPLDDPSDFSFFFDTSGRRTCYIAPERFYTATDNPEISKLKHRLALEESDGKRDGKVTEAMDCFSAGCVIAELFLEGAPLFTLSQLFKYREGELSVDGHLSAIEDEGVRSLIKQMIALEPSARPTFDTLLHTSRGTVFPECFYSFLHNYVSSINELPTPSPFAPTPAGAIVPATPVTTPMSPSPSTAPVGSKLNPAATGLTGADDVNAALPNDSDHRIDRIWEDYESVAPYLTIENGDKEAAEPDVKWDYNGLLESYKPLQDVFPVELHIPNRDSKLLPSTLSGRKAAFEDGPALILLSLICANIRNCLRPSSKIRALDVFLALSPHLTDEAKLDRLAPYIVDLLHDDAASVRAAALRTLMQVLMLVTVITPSNAAIFPEYIFPNISHLLQDPEVSVRAVYAQCMAPLADTAVRYLEMGQALRAHGTFRLSVDVQEEQAHFEVSYDASMQDLQSVVQDHLSMLLVDPSSVVKRAVLHNISSLCIFLRRQKANDVLLSHMLTYLNDREWLLRYAFFESIVDVAACVGGKSLEEYILPLMIQALSDVEETVVAKVLSSLTSLCELGLFQKMRIWELMSATLGFLYHPNAWIRQGAAAFIASAAKHLPPTDVWCILYPSLRHFLTSDVRDIQERSLLVAMKTPLMRQIFDSAVQWAMKAEKTQFWRGHRRPRSKVESPKDSMIASRKFIPPNGMRNRSEEDEAQLNRLRQLGMTQAEEAKLLAMRDYLAKLADAIASFQARAASEVEAEVLKTTGDVELQKLAVVPRTVFLKARVADVVPHSPRRSFMDSPRSLAPISPRRLPSEHGSAGTPFEDLRRRLATINGSTSSLTVNLNSRDHRLSLSPMPDAGPRPSEDAPALPPTFDRPSSPTESITSVAGSSAFRTVHKWNVGGDLQKAAPAIGSSRANAIGLLETASRIQSEGSPELSGRSSPVGTIREQYRSRVPAAITVSSYDGQEPSINNLLEHLYLDNNRDLQSDFGPRVHVGPLRRRNVVRQSYTSRDSGSRRAEATLIHHFTSHTDCITGLAVSPDHTFFVSSSDDKTLRVWDTARLERNVTSKARHTYSQHHARVKCVCMLDGFHCFASAGEDGSLHVVRVHVSQSGSLPKYGKLQVIREHRVDHPGEYITCMTHFETDTSSNLVYATTYSLARLIDLRTMRILQSMQNPRHHGPISTMCLDRKRAWVVFGTTTGVLSLWDLRFGILLKSWKVNAAFGGKAPRIYQCALHPTKGRGRWVMVAVESSRPASEGAPTVLIEVWDVEKTSLVEAYAVRTVSNPAVPIQDPETSNSSEADKSPAAAIAALVQARQQNGNRRSGTSAQSVSRETFLSSPSHDIRCLVAGVDFGGAGHRADAGMMFDGDAPARASRGFMLTGSEDRRLRLWDLGRPDRTTVLSSTEAENDKAAYNTVQSSSRTTHVETWVASPNSGSLSNRPPQRMSLINHSQQNLLKAHQDIISALACIDSPFRGGFVSGDRAGVIKVWRVDLSE